MNKYIIITFHFISSCNKPVADSAFVGEWYVLNLEDGKEHWTIDKKNRVRIYDRYNDTVLSYTLETKFYERFFTDFPNFYIISEDKQDSIVFDWIESSSYPPVIPKDTIRIYHGFVMLRNPNHLGLNKEIISNSLINNSISYEFNKSHIELFLSDRTVSKGYKRAYIKSTGCIEYKSFDEVWRLDTLSNNIVFEHGFNYMNQNFFINDINDSTLTTDMDDFYWFIRDKKIRFSNFDWDKEIMEKIDFKDFHYGPEKPHCKE